MKVKTTLNLDAALVRRIRVRAARLGKSDTVVYEEALREGLSAIDRLRALTSGKEDQEMHRLIDEAVHHVRHVRSKSGDKKRSTRKAS